jgi:hypothetical protein
MKTYTEFEKCLIIEDAYIPKDLGNKDYINALEEVKNKEAVFVSTLTKNELSWENARAIRNNLLKESDWISAPDAQPKPSKETWLSYRQALRDITTTFSNPTEIVWPVKPQ